MKRRTASVLALPAFVSFVLGLALVACGDDDPAAGPGGGGGTSGGPGGDGGPSGTSDGGPPLAEAKGDPCRGTALPDDRHYVAPGLCARRVASGRGGLRQIMFAPNGDLLGQSSSGKIWLFRDADGDGTYAPTEVHEWATTGGNGNNAHLDVAGGFVYAGSEAGVSRFAYDATTLTGGPAQAVVKSPPGGGHSLHTAHVYDGFLYVHSGSDENISHSGGTGSVDYDTERSLIRRFDLSKFSGTALEWSTGELVSVGIRNAVGFRRNEDTRKIYAVVNGLDNTHYGPAVSGPNEDVHIDNPGEQILEVAPGKRYGYPFCFTAQRVFVNGTTGALIPPGTQLRNVFDDNHASHTDAWCAQNSERPTAFVQAHSAPLDLVFFNRQPKGALPEEYRGGAFVAFHGSWNRETNQTGHKVVWQPFNPDGTAPQPTSTETTTTFPYKVIFGGGTSSAAKDGEWSVSAGGVNEQNVSPVGVDISPIDGALYISTDRGGMLYRVGIKK